MSKQRNKVIALALAGACGFGVYKAGQALLGDEAQGTKHAVNQIWIDHIPKDDRDMIMHMVLVDHRQGQFGAIGQSSQWRHMIDVFRWQLDGNKLGLYFPQDQVRGRVEIDTWRCAGEAPAPFELCMRITNKNGRSVVLYSRDDWKVDPKGVQDSIEDIVDDQPELEGLLHGFGEDQAEQLIEFELDEDAAASWPERQVF